MTVILGCCGQNHRRVGKDTSPGVWIQVLGVSQPSRSVHAGTRCVTARVSSRIFCLGGKIACLVLALALALAQDQLCVKHAKCLTSHIAIHF